MHAWAPPRGSRARRRRRLEWRVPARLAHPYFYQMPRIFSGIQPSGELHIGNYLGAVKNWVELQKQFETYICIVNYHAITVVYEPADLRRRTHDMAVSLLAAGIDPSQATLFVQSTVPEHTELSWIFNSVTPLGELERQTQFKEK